MDIISRAMRKGLHLCENIAAEEQTWERFLEVSEKKKAFYIWSWGRNRLFSPQLLFRYKNFQRGG